MTINHNTLTFSTITSNQPVRIDFIHPYGSNYNIVAHTIPVGHRATFIDLIGKELRVCFNQFEYVHNQQKFYYKNIVTVHADLKQTFDVLSGPFSTGDIVKLTKNQIRSQFCAALLAGKLQANMPVFAENLPSDATATVVGAAVHRAFTIPNGVDIMWPLLDVTFNVPQGANPFATTARQADGPYEYDMFSVAHQVQQQTQINTIYTGMFDSERKTTIQDLI